MTPRGGDEQAPEVSAAETVDAIVEASKREQHFPLRRGFLQQRVDRDVVPGPMGSLVRAGDQRALLLFLLLITKASSEPWNAALPAAVWARALDLHLPESKTARSTISKIWLRLERHNLVSRGRRERLADVYLRREDGSGDEYTSPGGVRENYFKIPLALWLEGPEDGRRWYQVLSLPELAVLLIGRSLGDGFRLPFEWAPRWYDISADTVARGVSGLSNRGLLIVNKRFKKAPLSAVGYTAEHRYTLQPPFGPIGVASGTQGGAAKASSKKSAAKKAPPKKSTAKNVPPRKSSPRSPAAKKASPKLSAAAKRTDGK